MSSNRFWEIFRFVLVGGTCFLIEYGLLYALTEFAGLHYLWSSAIAFVVSLLINYWMCVAIVFQGAGKQSFSQRLLFIGSSIAASASTRPACGSSSTGAASTIWLPS